MPSVNTVCYAVTIFPNPPSEAFKQAKKDFFDFLISDNAHEFIGSIYDLHDRLVEWKDSCKGVYFEEEFAQFTGPLFSELLNQVLDAGAIDESVGAVFFDDSTDQWRFANELAEDVMAYVWKQEKIQGRVLPPSEEATSEAKALMIEFLKSKAFEQYEYSLSAFRNKLQSIWARALGNEREAYIVSEIDSPCYFTLFDQLITDATDNQHLDKKVKQVVFAPRFNQYKFTRELIAEIHAIVDQEEGCEKGIRRD